MLRFCIQCGISNSPTRDLGVGDPARRARNVAFGLFAILLFVFETGCDGSSVDPEVEKKATADLRAAGARMSEDGGYVGKIDFSAKKLTDTDFANLGKLSRMQELILRGTTFDDASLAHLAGLPKLQRLSLKESSVTDSGLEHIAKITTLVQLDLEKTKVTDAGVQQLKTLKNLERLFLSGSTATSTSAINLKEELPKLSVSGP